MAKMKKRPAKKKPAKAKAKKSPKKAAKKTAKKQTAKAAPKKKISAPPAPSKPTAVKKAVPDEETRKTPASKGMPAMPKDPELDEEEIGERRSISAAKARWMKTWKKTSLWTTKMKKMSITSKSLTISSMIPTTIGTKPYRLT